MSTLRESLVALSQRHSREWFKLKDRQKVVDRLDQSFRDALVMAIAQDASLLDDPWVIHHAICYELHHDDPIVRQAVNKQIAQEKLARESQVALFTK